MAGGFRSFLWRWLGRAAGPQPTPTVHEPMSCRGTRILPTMTFTPIVVAATLKADPTIVHPTLFHTPLLCVPTMRYSEMLIQPTMMDVGLTVHSA